MKRYDTPTSLFFCDPPYATGSQEGYAQQWGEADHVALRDGLKTIAGQFVLTYDDSSLIRDLYEGNRIEKISQRKGISQKGGKRGEMKQLLIFSA